MSAGFNFRGETYWGTNGAIEISLEALIHESSTRFGTTAPMTRFLVENRESFNMGKVVFLDELLPDVDRCQRFLQVFEAATEQLEHDDVFTDYGRSWVKEFSSLLRQRIIEYLTA
jgi:hypothetical protein